MARNFALGDELDLALGSMTIASPFTFAAVVRRTATTGNGYNDVIVGHNSGGGTGTYRGWDCGFNPAAANKMYIYTASGTGLEDGPVLAVADGWAIAVWSKGSGTVTPRYHLYKFSTNTWTHANAGATLVDGTAPTAGGLIKLGRFETDTVGTMTGDIAAAAGWTRVLTDAEVENLVGPFQTAWMMLDPAFCVVLDQDTVTQKAVDLAQRSNESGRTGTTVSTSSVPMMNVYDGMWAITRAAAAGADKIISATINGVATVSATVNAFRNISASINGSSSVSASVVATKKIAAAINGVSLVTAFVTTGVGALTRRAHRIFFRLR